VLDEAAILGKVASCGAAQEGDLTAIVVALGLLVFGLVMMRLRKVNIALSQVEVLPVDFKEELIVIF